MKNLLNVILWCVVVVMWIVTLVADAVCRIPQWLMLVHAAFGAICLVAAILAIVRYRKGR